MISAQEDLKPEKKNARHAENDEKVSEKRPLEDLACSKIMSTDALKCPCRKNCSWLPKLF